MRRAQIILEEWQHRWLAEEAARRGTSMSALLRELLTEAIERRQMVEMEEDPLLGIVGLGAGPADGITSANLDQVLYRPSRPDPLSRVAEDEADYR